MFWGDGQTKNEVPTDILTSWFNKRSRSGRTNIFQNNDNFFGAVGKLNAERMGESVAMARSQRPRGLINHTTVTAAKLDAARI